ncbi:LytTR family DNA-binding domain-containing protein [Fulvivirgaceae bacterium PWU4]|uniref:LytTR family DNA-binding domain-containing protein n=1 Tax=Chryseosolibacter histidini TaxID=2782349 RepID=A0AAP2DTS9_9BACT|nr:LytTR family DNA-binding domain-containing protein [Chryseosolibacter histidini]MBT1700469.1 LytTR family DNA-binding domain-containing protein [Chryseosolibacter histidini]
MLKCVIIDDEPLARECIANYVKEVDFLQLVGTGSNPVELTSLLHEQQVDLVFLDIQMPVINGIEFLKMAQNPPMVIITTAYPSYALEGFQLDVLDYMVKPITFNRFFKGVSKAKDYHQLLMRSATAQPKTEADHFFIKCDYKYERIYFDDILYVQAMQNYITLYTTKGKYMTLLYLKNVEEKLDKQAFIRVHKSFIVAVSKIESIENNEIIIQSFRIPISRNYHEEVIGRVVNGKLWKK